MALDRALAGARNALEILRLGQLAPSARQPFEVIADEPNAKLRRYATASGDFLPADSPALVLVPPLMVTADIYDVSADASAVEALIGHGVAPFVVDFGAPEREEGGMRRTLDDHVLAVSRAIDRVRRLTARPVHLAGYSQGGMFCYQAAAFRRGEGLSSIVTFGSPVDMHRSVPAVRSEAVGAALDAVGPAVSRLLDRIEGLPAELTSTAFKLITPGKELGQRIDFLRKLHDRSALERREARRRFLGGEGFVAWPGPALRDFVEQFILQNRMLDGGFVIDGRTATLADVSCPILAFIGRSDQLARPAAVRGITRAAPEAEVSFVEVKAGHFGLVVGSRANQVTWPTVSAWVRWREGRGPRPAALVVAPPAREQEPAEAAFDDVEVDVQLLADTLTAAAGRAWKRLGDMAASASDGVRALRYQVPRFRSLETLHPDDPISPAQALARRAKSTPEATFFLWEGRAFNYREAERRVDAVARGFARSGVRRGDRVGVWMGSRPSFLSAATALSRLGAVAVIAPPAVSAAAVARAFDAAGAAHVLADLPRAPGLRAALGRDVLVLGAGTERPRPGSGLIDMEAIDPSAISLPPGVAWAGLARDLAMVLLRPGRHGLAEADLVPVPVTNHRWALSALGACGSCTLTPEDTVYSCLPLHHPTSLLVAVGGALVGGCRLALGSTSPDELFAPGDDGAARELVGDIRRNGATVVFYAGELLCGLLRAPARSSDRGSAIRLFAGSGLRRSTWRAVEERWGAGVMEFYASTAQRLVVANASGEKRGALGRPLPGSAAVALALLDRDTLELERGPDERLRRAGTDQPGLLLVAIDEGELAARESAGLPTVRDAFERGDVWAPTLDVMRRDRDGDLWFVGSLGERVRQSDGAGAGVWARDVEDALLRDADVEVAVAWRDPAPPEGPARVGAAVVLRRAGDAEEIGRRVMEGMEVSARPDYLRIVARLPMNDGFRVSRGALARMGICMGTDAAPGAVVLDARR